MRVSSDQKLYIQSPEHIGVVSRWQKVPDAEKGLTRNASRLAVLLVPFECFGDTALSQGTIEQDWGWQ